MTETTIGILPATEEANDPIDQLREKVADRIRGDIGDLMPDAMLQQIVSEAIHAELNRPVKNGQYVYLEEVPWIKKEILRVIYSWTSIPNKSPIVVEKVPMFTICQAMCLKNVYYRQVNKYSMPDPKASRRRTSYGAAQIKGPQCPEMGILKTWKMKTKQPAPSVVQITTNKTTQKLNENEALH